MKPTGDCSLFKDLVLFFATAIGIASGQFSVRPCSAGDELATPSAVYVFVADGIRTVCPTTTDEVNNDWGFQAGDGVSGNGIFTVTNETVANISCVEGNELRVRDVPSLSAVVPVPGTFNITFISTSAEIELQVNYFPKGFYMISDGSVLVFPLEMGEDPPRPWSSYGIIGLDDVKVCEETDGGLNESTLFSRTPVIQNQCLEGIGQGVQLTSSGPFFHDITLMGDISAEDVGTHQLVLVEGTCQSPTVTSESLTVNVSLPAPEPNLTTSMVPTPTPTFTTPTPSPNSSTVTPTPNPTDDPSSPPGSDGLSTEELAAIIVVVLVVVVLLGVGVIVFVICCRKKPYRRRKHSFPRTTDADLAGRYNLAPGPVTELSESVQKPPLEGALVTAGPSREVVQPIIIPPIQKSSVVITAEESPFYNELGKRLAEECHTSLHQPDLTDRIHFPQLISRLLIDQNYEWLFLIGSHTLEHRVENGLDHSTKVPIWQAMQELITAAYPEDQLSKVVYVQLGAPSRRTIETPVTTVLIPSSSNTPDYTGTQCADEILKDPKVKKRLEKKAIGNETVKPPSLVPRQVVRLQGEPPASDPTHRRRVDQPDGENGVTGSGSLTNMLLNKVNETLQEHTKVMKDIRDSSVAQVGHQATIAENTSKTANKFGEIQKDTVETLRTTQQILDGQQAGEGGEDKTENVT